MGLLGTSSIVRIGESRARKLVGLVDSIDHLLMYTYMILYFEYIPESFDVTVRTVCSVQQKKKSMGKICSGNVKRCET